MAISIIILFVFAILHFVFESIIAPNIRLELRFELFKLRDSLRNIKLNNELSKNDLQVFSLIDETICVALNRLPYFNLQSNFDAFNEYESNKDFKDRVLKKTNLIENTNIEEFKIINKKIMKTTFKAFLTNIGGFIIMLIPIVLLFFTLSLFSNTVKSIFKKIKNSVKNLILANENEFQRFAHN